MLVKKNWLSEISIEIISKEIKMKKFKVGVFSEQGKRKMKYRAYTMWYSTDWQGCRTIEVNAENGTEAKKKAILMAKNMDGNE